MKIQKDTCDKALKALEHSGFSPELVGAPDDPCIYVNVWNDAMSEAHEMRLHDTEIMWWAGIHDTEFVS